jgi:hypothetical protein
VNGARRLVRAYTSLFLTKTPGWGMPDLRDTCLVGANHSGAVLDEVKVGGADVAGAVVDPDVAAHIPGWPQPGQNSSACL